MKKYICQLTTCILMFYVGSCGEYLDLKSDATLLVPTTLEDLQSILDDSNIMNLRMTSALAVSASDFYYLPHATYVAQGEILQALYTGNKGFEQSGTSTDWAKAYQVVYNCNLVLDIISEISRTPVNGPAYDNVLGSAHFFRGFYFLELILQHAHAFDEETADNDLGIALRKTSDFNVPSFRATVRESYDHIIEDLSIAIELLPDFPEHVMRPSRAAAHAVMARTYLNMRKYDRAMFHAEKSLALENRLMNFNGDDDVLDITANVPFRKFNKETLFYAETNGSPIFTTNRGLVDTVLYESYDDNDLRKTAFFRLSGGNAHFKGSYAGHASILFGGISVNEVYLTLAECQASLSNVDDAMNTLNALLITRWDQKATYVPLTASDMQEALEIIREERKKELCFRNIRWGDIKRYNKEGVNLVLRRKIDGEVVELQPNDSFYALPIPKDVVEITGMPQN